MSSGNATCSDQDPAYPNSAWTLVLSSAIPHASLFPILQLMVCARCKKEQISTQLCKELAVYYNHIAHHNTICSQTAAAAGRYICQMVVH